MNQAFLITKGLVLFTVSVLAACAQGSGDNAVNSANAEIERIQIEGKAKSELIALAGAQEAWKISSPTFSSEINPLNMDFIDPDGPHYTYEIVSADDKSVKMTATAKVEGIASFSAVVSTAEEGSDSTQSLICKTDESSTTPPDMVDVSGCPEGSSDK